MSNSGRPSSEQQLANSILSSPLLQDVLNKHFAVGGSPSQTATLDELMSVLQQVVPGATLKKLGGEQSNNINVAIETDNAALVIQIGIRFPSSYEAIESLKTNSKSPEWLANSYGEVIYAGQSDYLENESPHKSDLNNFDTTYKGYISVLEKCAGSLEGEVDAFHKNAANNDNNTAKITLTKNIGTQIAVMLEKNSSNNVIWTDMKPGNILLRGDGKIAIADMKAFTPLNKMLYRVFNNNNVVNYGGVVTEGFLSQDFRQNKLEAPCDRQQLKVMWEKESSYQMAVMLYYVATGHQIISPRWATGTYEKFDFDKPVFKTNDGQGERLQAVIERLGRSHPDARLNVKDAVELLNNLDNKKVFTEKLEKIDLLISARLGAGLLNETATAGTPRHIGNIALDENSARALKNGSTELKKLTVKDLDVINLDKFGTVTMTELRNKVIAIGKELDGKLPTGLTNAEQTSLKIGYAYAGLNTVMTNALAENSRKETATNAEEELKQLRSERAKLTQQAEILRLVCADIDKPLQNSLERVQKKNQENLDSLIIERITRGVKEPNFDVAKSFKENDSVAINLGYQVGNFGVKPNEGDNSTISYKFKDGVENYLKLKFLHYVDQGTTMVDSIYPAAKDVGTEKYKYMAGTRDILAEAWGRTVAKIQRDMNANVTTHTSANMEDLFIATNPHKQDFASVCEFASDMLSIQKNYEKRWQGLKGTFNEKEQKSQDEKDDVVKGINRRLETLLKSYPEKSLLQIREEMNKFLETQSASLQKKGHEKTALHQFINRSMAKNKLAIDAGKKIQRKQEVQNVPQGIQNGNPDFITAKCIANEMLHYKDASLTLNEYGDNHLQRANVDQEKFINKMHSYAEIGNNLINPKLNVKDGRTEFGKNNIQQLKTALTENWAQTACAIDRELSDKKKNPLLDQGGPNIEMAVKSNDNVQRKEFEKVVNMTAAILSITKRYENKWFGIKHMFAPNEAKVKLITSINNEFARLLTAYPETIKTHAELRAQMVKFLEQVQKEDKSVENTSALKEQIGRVITNFEEKKTNANADKLQEMKAKKPANDAEIIEKKPSIGYHH